MAMSQPCGSLNPWSGLPSNGQLISLYSRVTIFIPKAFAQSGTGNGGITLRSSMMVRISGACRFLLCPEIMITPEVLVRNWSIRDVG
jgi:hypothetical protein